MPSLLTQLPLPSVSAEMVMSLLSVSVTGYFWLVRSRQERPFISILDMAL